MLAGGVTDTRNPSPVSCGTLFQAASLSKPVSAAIVLDWLKNNELSLNTPLVEMGEYGPPEIRKSPYYHTLTIGMVIGQCSGLPNWFEENSPKAFLMEPGKHFIYSGLAFEFLKELIEKQSNRAWEKIAQDFFSKAGMKTSTYQQCAASRLYGANNVAREHQGDLSPLPNRVSEDSEAVFTAGSLLTTASDYLVFLRYCLNDAFLRSTLLTPTTLLGHFPETPTAPDHIQWGLGMGIFHNQGKTIAFHWGNNTGSHAFCAMDMGTGDAVACFVNSENGPNIFQQCAEQIVGDMALLFQWLSNYCGFNAAIPCELSISPKVLMRSGDINSDTPSTVRSLLSTSSAFFRRLENDHLIEHRHDDDRLQHEYDKRFGLVPK